MTPHPGASAPEAERPAAPNTAPGAAAANAGCGLVAAAGPDPATPGAADAGSSPQATAPTPDSAGAVAAPHAPRTAGASPRPAALSMPGVSGATSPDTALPAPTSPAGQPAPSGDPLAPGAAGPQPATSAPVWLTIPFVADPRTAGEGPLTWGQYHMWQPMLRYGPAFATLSLRQVLAVAAPGVSVDECAAGIRRLVERHAGLRTRFTEGEGGGGPRQVAVAEGSFLVEVHEVAGDSEGALAAFAERRSRKLAAEPFRHSHEWPVRFGLVCRQGMVRAVVLVCSHLAFDGWSADLVGRELRALLGGGGQDAGQPTGQDIWQPLDQAAYEQSDRGRRENDRTLRHWRARLAEVPDAPPRPPLDRPAAPPIQQWWLTSPALAAASVAVADRTRTSSSTVLLTLAATALAALRRQDTVPLLLIAGNRLTERQQAYAGATAQDGLLLFDRGSTGADRGLNDAVREVYRRSAASYLRGRFDRAALTDLTAELDARRRHPLDLSGYFNDARLSQDWVLGPGPHPRSARGPAFVRGYDRNDMSFCLVLAQQGADCRVSLLADTRVLPADAIPGVLSGLESLLCEAATADVPLAAVPAALGLA